MTKRWRMGPDPGGVDDPGTINLALGFVGGPGSITRHDENGNASTNPFDTVPIIGRVYIADTPENRAALVGDSFSDELLGTGGDDLIVWENRRSGLGFPEYYLLPGGGVAAIDNFLLGAGNDLLDLTYTSDNNPSTPDIPYGANANIDGGSGDDIVWSGGGNDVITGGGGGSEILYGGGGNDLIVGSPSAFNNISGDSGNDELYGGSSGDGIVGGLDNDTASGGGGADFVDGEAGDDTIYGGGANDNVFGGDDSDRVYGDDGADNVDGGAGFLDTLYGGTGNDNITDPDGAKFVFGNSENDVIQISYLPGWNQGVSSLYGGAGVDTIVFTGAQNSPVSLFVRADEASGVGDANDTISARNSYAGAVAFMGGGDDIYGYLAFVNANGARVDTVYGGTGSDVIGTGIGADFLFGDEGDDTLEGGADGDTMYGGSETDIISYAASAAGVTMGLTGVAGIGGDAQDDVAWTDVENLTGSAQSDSLYGNASVNVIRGGAGNDTVEGLGGGDTLYGGDAAGESNWLSYANSDQGVNVNFLAGTGTGGHADGDIVSNFQNIIGSAHNDVLVGSATSNIIEGGAGLDAIEGGGGSDTLYGGTGIDTVEGGAGGDTMYGGGDNDFLSYASSAAGVVVSLAGAGSASGGDAASDVFSGFRHLIGSAQADTLTGDTNGNSITGGGGADTIEGGAGGDALFGGGGNVGDWLSYAGSAAGVTVNLATGAVSGGDAAGDSISGFQNLLGSGQADSLTGSAGANTINAGNGNDVVAGGAGGDSLIGGGGTDELSYATAPVDGDTRGAGVIVTLGSGVGSGSDAAGDTNSGFENLTGSEFTDSLGGDVGGNIIRGLAGFDQIGGAGGNDTLYGGLGNDMLAGEAGLDTLFGEDGLDVLLLNSDGSVGVGGTNIAGWDGEAGSAQIVVNLTAGTALYGDTAFGGLGEDTLDMSGASNLTARTAYFSGNANIAQILAGVEIIIAGTAADVINLTFNNGTTRTAYAENVTIFAGAGADVVFSGSGNDLVVGGRAASGDNREVSDTLYGGQGNDRIVGDDLEDGGFGGADFLYGGQGDDTAAGGVGNDSIYGGAGIDSLEGGDGDDRIFDSDGASFVYGGMGSDVISITFNNPLIVGGGGGGDGDGGEEGVPIVLYGGSNDTDDGTDGNDRVFVAGDYDEIVAGLGAGNDLYISSRVGTGSLRDFVDGQDGADIISSWLGDDVLDGGGGDDVIWGGAGVDTVTGGIGTDILYGGAGDGDLLIGGGGIDYYYWARGDGDDRIDDRNGAVAGDPRENYIVVFPAFTHDGIDSDGLVDGQGVADPDRDIYDNDDTDGFGDDEVMIELADPGGDETLYYLHVLNADGSVNQSMLFDRDEISVIMLWNNDATGSTPVITGYRWVDDAEDPLGGRYQPV